MCVTHAHRSSRGETLTFLSYFFLSHEWDDSFGFVCSVLKVHSHVDVYNFSSNKWVERFDTPKEMANSHLGVATDGRYAYVVSGQYGPQCRGPVARVFVLDTHTKKWNNLPPLPFPRSLSLCLSLFVFSHC